MAKIQTTSDTSTLQAKTIVFGLLTTDSRRMFRQYDKFDMHVFARFLKAAVRRFGKICMILDKAPQHRAKMIRRLVEMTDGLTLKFLPAATPEISAIEPYWKKLKRKVLDMSHTSLAMLRSIGQNVSNALYMYMCLRKPCNSKMNLRHIANNFCFSRYGSNTGLLF